MGYGAASVTENSRTRNVGDKMAHCRAQPLATASSAFKVVLISLPKIFFMMSFTIGMRVEPPTISTASISETLRPMREGN